MPQSAPVFQSLPDAARAVSYALGQYSALRPALFRELATMPKGWQIQYRRDPAEGVAGVPVKWSHAVSTDFKVAGMELEAGVATIDTPETYAPFHDFKLLDADGTGATPGTVIEKTQMRLSLLLEKLLQAATLLAGGFAFIETQAPNIGARVDITPLSRLAVHLPVFPYWTTLRGMTQADWDGITAEEKPLLDDARVTLHRLSHHTFGSVASALSPGSGSPAQRLRELRKQNKDLPGPSKLTRAGGGTVRIHRYNRAATDEARELAKQLYAQADLAIAPAFAPLIADPATATDAQWEIAEAAAARVSRSLGIEAAHTDGSPTPVILPSTPVQPKAADSPAPIERLGDRHVNALEAMQALGATERDKRKNAGEIARRADGQYANEDLANRGFARSAQGAKGGSWITPEGKRALKDHKRGCK
jgi:hypothetical protein